MQITVELDTNDNYLDVTVDVNKYYAQFDEVEFDIVSIRGGDDEGNTVEINAVPESHSDELHTLVLESYIQAVNEQNWEVV